jgi:hypothetical protein
MQMIFQYKEHKAMFELQNQEATQDGENYARNDHNLYSLPCVVRSWGKSKAVPLHAIEAFGGR